jgi:hypothetical protein
VGSGERLGMTGGTGVSVRERDGAACGFPLGCWAG